MSRLGGISALSLFGLILITFVSESCLTQHVQVNLGYRQPFMIFYIAHSSISVIFPLHLLYLTRTSGLPAKAYILGLKTAIINQLQDDKPSTTQSPSLPVPRATFLILLLTVWLAFPTLLWYAAVSLTSISDVTAIWNTNAFWAYVITVKVYKGKWEAQKLAAVLLACFGVFLVVYGGKDITPEPDLPALVTTPPRAPMLGNVITLFASVMYAGYQVYYAHRIALPSDEVEIVGDYEPIPSHPLPISHNSSMTRQDDHAMVYPPPFALHPNLITSCMGICTLVLLWPLLPVLDWLRLETFYPPPDVRTWLYIVGIACSGLVFTGSYMVLLGIWGPVFISVASLLTIVVMLMVDILWFGREAVTLRGMAGCGMISGGFGILVWDVLRLRR